MVEVPFDPSDLIIPAFDADAKTFELKVGIHPGQARLLNYFAASENSFGFQHIEGVARWCIAWGTHTLLGPPPPTFRFAEAKMNVLQDERFQRGKDTLSESIRKYLASGERETARRVVLLAYEEYSQISIPYFRALWLSTLQPVIELLNQQGIRIPTNGPRAFHGLENGRR